MKAAPSRLSTAKSALGHGGASRSMGVLLWSWSTDPENQWPKHGRKWVRPRTAGHIAGRPTRTDDGAGELGPSTVRTVHSSGGELWAMLSGWDLPSATHVHVVVVVAVIQQEWVLFIFC